MTPWEERVTPPYVDMARLSGRPEPDFEPIAERRRSGAGPLCYRLIAPIGAAAVSKWV